MSSIFDDLKGDLGVEEDREPNITPDEEQPQQPIQPTVQQSQEVEPNRLEAPINAMAGQSAITELESSEDLIENYSNYLSGMEKYYDRKTRSWRLVKVRDPIMNVKGVNLIVRTLQSTAHRNTNMSNFSPERIYQTIYTSSGTLARTLFVNQREYGIRDEDFVQLNPILIDVMRVMEATMRRAQEGNEQRLVLSATKQSKVEVTNTEPPRESFLSRLNPLK